MFYIKPPNGQVPLHILENCVLARVEYLELLHCNNADKFEGKFEYLLENSSYDKIGHFTLRLLAAVHTDLAEQWIAKETLLFRQRLKYISLRQLYRLFRRTEYEARNFLDEQLLINNTLKEVCMFFSNPKIFRHIVSANHSTACQKIQYKVKFKTVPDLVRKREVDLYGGYAIFYCSQWKQVFSSLFLTYLTKQIKCLKLTAEQLIEHDARFNALYQKIYYVPLKRNKNSNITVNNIDEKVNKFPLCMQHLHNKLRTTHRLSHYARLYYGLFLKDSGMPIKHALAFWREEYSKPHACSSVCSHDWQSNERKFIYSIRHLYGLEGSKKKYQAPTCESLCKNIPSTRYEGGCPFSNFDKYLLKDMLKARLSEEETKNFLQKIVVEDAQTSCAIYFKLLHKRNTKQNFVHSPITYYLELENSF